MPTTREVTAARAQRLQRQRRYYTPDLLGPQCRAETCHLKLDKVLAAAGETTHATCTPEHRRLIRLFRATRELHADVDAEEQVMSLADDVATSPPDDT